MNEQQSESQSAEREQATPAKPAEKPHPAWRTLYPIDGLPGSWGPSETEQES